MAISNGHTVANAEDCQEAHDQAIAISFVRCANRHHQAYLQEIWNQFLNCLDLYPRLLTEAYNVMQHRVGDQAQYTPSGDGLTFTTVGKNSQSNNPAQHDLGPTCATDGKEQEQTTVPGTDGKTYANIRCYECNHYGHYASHCPQAMPCESDKQESTQQHLTVSFSFTQ